MTEHQSITNKIIKTPLKHNIKSKIMNVSTKGSLSNESKEACETAANCTSVNGTLANPMAIKRKNKKKKTLPPYYAFFVSYF